METTKDKKHTPGPWRINIGTKGYLNVGSGKIEHEKPYITVQSNFHSSGLISNGPEATIVECLIWERASQIGGKQFDHVISLDEAKANAKLIAAAPEMLEALEKLLPKLSQLQDESAFTWPEKIEALIAKAK